jgi:hypothetical protein
LTNTVQRVPGEPTNWARIKLPPNTPVWVFAPFVKDGTVNVSRLNVRAGRGENYSVIGRLNRGEEVKAIRTVEEWIEIEPPTNAYAFVDIGLLKFGGEVPTIAAVPQNNQPPVPAATAPVATEPTSNNTTTAVATVPANTTAEPTNNVVISPEPVTTQPDNPSATVTQPEVAKAPSTNELEVTTARPANAEETKSATTVQPETAVTLPESSPLSPIIVATPAPTDAAATTASAAPVERRVRPPGKRIVRREGIVRPTTSIQAPTWYELVNADTKKRINYLFGDNLEINLKDYRGQRVVVSGEELIDSRWPNTPIMDLQSLDVLPDESR